MPHVGVQQWAVINICHPHLWQVVVKDLNCLTYLLDDVTRQVYTDVAFIWSIMSNITVCPEHGDVIKWKHFPRYWSFVRGIHRSPVIRCIRIGGLLPQWPEGKHGDSWPCTRHHSDVIKSTMRLKSPVSRLFAQPFVQAQIIENIKSPRHWPLWGEWYRWPVDSPHKGPVR